MWFNLLKTTHSVAPTVLRGMLGLVLFAHGAQKMLGWFGGYGFNGTMQYFTQTAHLPWLIAFLVILIEFVGAILMIAGAMVRPTAVAVIVLFLGIILSSHLSNGFFMNWFGSQKGEGYEYHLLVIAMAVSLFITGAGEYSVDGQIDSREHAATGSEQSVRF